MKILSRAGMFSEMSERLLPLAALLLLLFNISLRLAVDLTWFSLADSAYLSFRIFESILYLLFAGIYFAKVIRTFRLDSSWDLLLCSLSLISISAYNVYSLVISQQVFTFVNSLAFVFFLIFVDRYLLLQFLKDYKSRINNLAAELRYGALVADNTLEPDIEFELKQDSYLSTDSILISESVLVEERLFSDSSYILRKEAGEEVYAASKILSASAKFKVLRSSQDSLNSQLKPEVHDNYRPIVKQSLALLIIFIAAFFAIYTYRSQAELIRSVQVFADICFLFLLSRYLRIEPLLADYFINAGLKASAFFKSSDALLRLGKNKNLIINYETGSEPKVWKVLEFIALDDRIELAALKDLVFSVSTYSRDSVILAISDYLREKIDINKLPEVHNFFEPGQAAITANCLGVELTIGAEDLLLERGIELQESEVQGNADKIILVAVNKVLAAKIVLQDVYYQQWHDVILQLKNIGIQVMLFSRQKAESLSLLIDRLGVPIEATKAGLIGDSYLEQLALVQDSTLYSAIPVDDDLLNVASLKITNFDCITVENNKFDIYLLNPSALDLLHAYKTARRYCGLRRIIYYILIIVTAVLAGLCFFGASIVLPCFIAVITSLMLYALLWQQVDS